MELKLESRKWPKEKCAVFFRLREQHGKLSNMSGGFGLTVNGLWFQSSEGLYQALKFPYDVAIQKEIALQRTGIEAKKTAYAHYPSKFNNPNWDSIKLDAMAFSLGIKLLQHPQDVGEALLGTGNVPIVERSSRDPWWGAILKGDYLEGVNVLGRLLTILRNTYVDQECDVYKTVGIFIAQVDTSTFQINGERVLKSS